MVAVQYARRPICASPHDTARYGRFECRWQDRDRYSPRKESHRRLLATGIHIHRCRVPRNATGSRVLKWHGGGCEGSFPVVITSSQASHFLLDRRHMERRRVQCSRIPLGRNIRCHPNPIQGFLWANSKHTLCRSGAAAVSHRWLYLSQVAYRYHRRTRDRTSQSRQLRTYHWPCN